MFYSLTLFICFPFISKCLLLSFFYPLRCSSEVLSIITIAFNFESNPSIPIGFDGGSVDRDLGGGTEPVSCVFAGKGPLEEEEAGKGPLEKGATVCARNVVFVRSGVDLGGGVGGDLGSREDCLPRFGGDGSSSGGSFSFIISSTICDIPCFS